MYIIACIHLIVILLYASNEIAMLEIYWYNIVGSFHISFLITERVLTTKTYQNIKYFNGAIITVVDKNYNWFIFVKKIEGDK